MRCKDGSTKSRELCGFREGKILQRKSLKKIQAMVSTILTFLPLKPFRLDHVVARKIQSHNKVAQRKFPHEINLLNIIPSALVQNLRPDTGYTYQIFLVVFLSPLRSQQRQYLKLANNRFVPHSLSSLTIHCIIKGHTL